MNKFLSIFSIIFILPIAVCAQSNLKLQGDAAFASEDYQQAITLYTQQEATGLVSHELYYNLGCAFYRQDELAQAILYFERALRLKPNDVDTRENLSLCYSRTQDHIQQLPETLVTRWWRALTHLLSPNGWRILFLVFLALLGAGIVWFNLGRNIRSRRAALFSSVVLFVIVLLTTGLMLQAVHEQTTHNEAIITIPLAVVKVSPEANSNEKFTLHEGTKVFVDEQLNNYYRIRLADGNKGWIDRENIAII